MHLSVREAAGSTSFARCVLLVQLCDACSFFVPWHAPPLQDDHHGDEALEDAADELDMMFQKSRRRPAESEVDAKAAVENLLAQVRVLPASCPVVQIVLPQRAAHPSVCRRSFPTADGSGGGRRHAQLRKGCVCAGRLERVRKEVVFLDSSRLVGWPTCLWCASSRRFAGKAAVHKLRLLSKVEDQLKNKKLHVEFLDGGLLGAWGA